MAHPGLPAWATPGNRSYVPLGTRPDGGARRGPSRTLARYPAPHCGSKDKDYDINWSTERCPANALRLGVYMQGAEREDSER